MDAASPVRWSVVGVGRAGLARARAIVTDPRCRLVSVFRGRNAERFPGARMARSVDDALTGAEAVAICSPDAHHADQVRQALDRGLHVVCEYPLAPTAEQAAWLFARARETNRVLHVEHIELLHAPQVALRAHVRRDPIRELEVHFQSAGPVDASPADVVSRSLARIHRAIDLCGPVHAIDTVESTPGLVAGRLTHVTRATTDFRWEQSPYLSRATTITARTFGGDTWTLTGDLLKRGRMPQTLVETDGLFEQDHAAAMGRILDGRKSYVDEATILHALDVRQRILDGRLGAIGAA